jgi:MFS family permease
MSTPSQRFIITRTIWLIALVSLFTDVASEMLYPVMPIYLQGIGFSVVWLGWLEGFAEAVAGLGKGYFGKLSDSWGRRLPFVQWGYGLSALAKPLLAVSAWPAWVLLARTLDRLGKGLRTGARDALLSGEATPQTKAQVFGFHRSMDTLGAVLGPLLALAYLHFFPGQYVVLFLLAAIPGALAVAATLALREKSLSAGTGAKVSLAASFGYWREAPAPYRQLVAALLGFALFNSSDVFLLLKMKASGLDDRMVIGVYIFYNLVYALFAYKIGKLADRLGFGRIMSLGLLLFAATYLLIATGQGLGAYLPAFALYGLFAACTEGVAKAWISNLVPKTAAASALGTFAGLGSLAALLASGLTGWAWSLAGPGITLGLSAGGALVVAGYLARAGLPERLAGS